MAYNKEDLEKQALKAIQSNENIVFIQDVIAELPCSSAMFYLLELEKLETIKSALNVNRVNIKRKMRTSWLENKENATLQLALYKLVADNEERDALTMQKSDITTQGEKIGTVSVEIIHTVKDSSD